MLAGHVHGITAMSFDDSGGLLATASRDGTARIWDLATRSATTVLLPGAAGRGIRRTEPGVASARPTGSSGRRSA